MTDNQKEVYRPGAIKLEGIQLYNFKKNSVMLDRFHDRVYYFSRFIRERNKD